MTMVPPSGLPMRSAPADGGRFWSRRMWGSWSKCERWCRPPKKELGPIDTLVNNAGVFPRVPFSR